MDTKKDVMEMLSKSGLEFSIQVLEDMLEEEENSGYSASKKGTRARGLKTALIAVERVYQKSYADKGGK